MDDKKFLEVPFNNLSAQYLPIREQVIERWNQIIDSTQFISGYWVEQFESGFSQLHNVKHCVAVSNGTTAIELALRALDIRGGDEVILPVNTFIATAEAVSNLGATPIFVDCNSYSNIDIGQIVYAVTDRTVGIIGVHLYGNPADFDEISQIAKQYGLWTIEDAAQAHLATYHGRKVGSLGDFAAFSFYPGKNLGAPGEGGALTTNRSDLAQKVRKLRNHGQSAPYTSELIGGNSRMSELIAAVLDLKLNYLEDWTDSRRTNARTYNEFLKDVPSIDLIPSQLDRQSSCHLFVIHSDQRNALRQTLTKHGITTGLHYPIPIHLQGAYVHLGYKAGSFPVAENRALRMISLPMYAELTNHEVLYVCSVLEQAT